MGKRAATRRGIALMLSASALLSGCGGGASGTATQVQWLTRTVETPPSPAAKHQAYRAGYQAGFRAGGRRGYGHGYARGVRAGRTIGVRAGYAEGHRVGVRSGKAVGYDKGYADASAAVSDTTSPASTYPSTGAPTTENFGNGNGYVVTCADGTLSDSGGIQGACSHHGGVG